MKPLKTSVFEQKSKKHGFYQRNRASMEKDCDNDRNYRGGCKAFLGGANWLEGVHF